MSLSFNSRLLLEIEAHPGQSHKPMEDSSAYFIAPAAAPLIEEIAVAVVADGIGEHPGGEETSRIAVDTVKQYFLSHSTTDPIQTISSSIEVAHNAILERKRSILKLAGMGSTVTVAVIAFSRKFNDTVELLVGSVGDSRAYLIRAGEAKRITTDHTWVQEELEAGRLNRKEATVHPNRHVLTRYLGMIGIVTPDISPMKLLWPGDTVLLCTDGLTDLVDVDELKRIINSRKQTPGLKHRVKDSELKAIIAPRMQPDGRTELVQVNELKGITTPKTQDTAAQRLVSLALERGGCGNITVMTIELESLVPLGARVAAPVIPQSIVNKPLSVAALLLGSILLLGLVVLWAFRPLEPRGSVHPTLGIAVTGRTPTSTMTVAPTTATASETLVPRTSTPTIVEATITPSPLPNTLTPTVQSSPMIVISRTATVQSSPTSLLSPTPTTQPTAALRYPAIKLREPQNRQIVLGESVTFEWQESELQQSGDTYELWLRQLGSTPLDKSFQVAGGKLVLNIRDTMGYSDYVWSIFVRDAQRQIVGQSEERMITWQPKQPPEPGQPSKPSRAAQPTSPFVK